jgi:hypothetical protein
MMMWEARKMARRSPIVMQTPRPLLDTSISRAAGAQLSYFGYHFEIPWEDIDPAQTKLYRNHVTLRFRSGRYMMFSSMPPRYFVDEVVRQMGNEESLRATYGDTALQSDYAMWSMILETTPGKIGFLSSRKDTVGNSMLLLVKEIAAPERSGLFALQSGTFRGFQWGDPQKQPGHVVADLYSNDRGLEFVFSGKSKQNPHGICQAEINRVLQSVHKATDRSSQSNSKPVPIATNER